MILSVERLGELKTRIGMEANCFIGNIPTQNEIDNYLVWVSKNHKIPLEEVREFLRIKYLESLTKVICGLGN